jgi:uncharacterized Tic20 family protein
MSEEMAANHSTKEDNNTAVIMDIAMLFVFLFSPLILYLIKKDRPFVLDQARENLNMNITVLLGWILSAVLSIIFIGVIGYIIIGIYFLVVTILAAVANSKGQFYRYPFIIRLIK